MPRLTKGYQGTFSKNVTFSRMATSFFFRRMGSRAVAAYCTATAVSGAFAANMLLGDRGSSRFTFTDEAKPWKRLPNPSEKTTERVTKTQFPNAVVREDMDDKLLRLCAVSVRCMMGLCFLEKARAYSFGVYLGSSAVEDLCGPNGSFDKLNPVPKDQFGPGPFYAAPKYSGSRDGYVFQIGPSGLGYYRDPRSTKEPSRRVASPVLIRLVMLHDVDGEHLSHGFEKTLKSRVKQHMKDSTEELVQLTRMKNTFNKLGRIEKGSTFDLCRSDSGVLTLAYNGEALDHYDALLIGWACVDAFIGAKGHLPTGGKKELVEAARAVYEVKPLAEFL